MDLGDEIHRVLAPLGTAFVDGKKTVKPWPGTIDSWPHWLHGPDNNAVSRDRQVGISRSLQWIMPPAWGRHHNLLYSVNAMVSDNGRIYYIMDEAPIGIRGPTDKWTLSCRDAFNGLDLWKRPITNWGAQLWSDVQVGGTMRFRGPDQLFRRLVAAGDTVYVTLGFNEPVVALDGRTGEIVMEYTGTEDTSTIQFKEGVLYLTGNTIDDQPGKTVTAVEAESGRVLWKRTGYGGVTPQGNELRRFTDAHLTVGDKHLFLLDRDDVVGVDMVSGVELWRAPRPQREDVFGHYLFNFKNYCTLVYHEGQVFLGQLYSDKRNLNAWQEKDMDIWAWDAATGEKLWEHTGMSLAHFTAPDLFIRQGLVWTMKKGDVSLVGLDRKTGQVRNEYPVKDMLVGHHHRCYRNKATANFYLAGEEGIEYIDFNTGALDVHHWMRGACSYGIMPANGLIYLPAHACGCHGNAKLNGFLALANRPDFAITASRDGNRIEQGPAYGRPRKPHPETHGKDWPTYKHDNLRSNSSPSTVPEALTQVWSVPLGGKITAPTIAQGKVFLAAKDRHRVHCLDAETGMAIWEFTADGRIDSPPTFDNDRLFFGTRSGSVYSLTADTGDVVWRFQASPAAGKLIAYGQLESLWPVNGTVLVQGDKVFCTAGRSMNLDSGIFAYVLDAASGVILQQAQYQADPRAKGEVAGSVLAGILVGDENKLFMRDMQINPNDISEHGVPKAKPFLTPRSGGLLDSSWYNSAYWEYLNTRAQMLVFDYQLIVGVAAYRVQSQKSYSHDVASVGSGYRLFAVSLVQERNQAETPSGASKKGKRGTRSVVGRSSFNGLWQQTIPVRAEAIVVTDRAVCLAGAPDVTDENDPWGAFEDRRGGRLMVLSKSDGGMLDETELCSAPIYDGMAVANGRIFLSLKNGNLVCY